ncbi:MAG: Uma2 family endonuclease [Chloroflexota bacterium]|nr:Uma2 family endonuclease [Chloroflexota bacterium]
MAKTYNRGAAESARSRHRFTVDEYHRMIEAGILDEYDRVELIGGEIVEMSAMGARHAASVSQLSRRLYRLLGDQVSIRVQLPLTIPGYDEPEPDVAVCRFREDEYALAHPTSSDALIAIEVSDSTLSYDAGEKLGIYARAAIPEVWIVDLTRGGDAIYRHSDPDSGRYRTVVRFVRGEDITSALFPNLALSVGSVLGPNLPALPG